MTKTLQELAEAVTRLPAADRAYLAEHILSSLDDTEIEKAWAEESTRRRDEVRSGRVKPVEAEEVYRRIDALLQR